jgi:hypothetical protein
MSEKIVAVMTGLKPGLVIAREVGASRRVLMMRVATCRCLPEDSEENTSDEVWE